MVKLSNVYSSNSSYLRRMLYRRKFLLALLELLGGEAEKLRIQKLTFLFGQREHPLYDFVPYRFGSFSISMASDLGAMAKHGQVAETENTVIQLAVGNWFSSLSAADQQALQQMLADFGKLSTRQLTTYTYRHYPYYASKSEIANELLNSLELEKVNQSVRSFSQKQLFTIGYEGISLESYLNKLLQNGVRLLVDVRRNPLSMKFGFSKGQLQKYCGMLGISYVHLPELGIASEQRQTLNTQADYDALFEAYKSSTLNETTATQTKVLHLLWEYDRIALTCFEANICQCHRKPLAESIAALPGFDYRLEHL